MRCGRFLGLIITILDYVCISRCYNYTVAEQQYRNSYENIYNNMFFCVDICDYTVYSKDVKRIY